MKIQIKSIAGSVLFEGDFSSIADAVSAAVKSSADLRSADLRSADLQFANLRSANLQSADLRSADLRFADLRSANLRFADLRSADLRSADLRSANLRFADLRSADLRSADLRSANLQSANLQSADLRSADLRSADLQSANLQSADLRSADLRSADLRFAKNSALSIAATRILPEGDIIGWKKCKDGIIAKLLIPADAKRSHAFGRKCRAEFVKVLEVWDGREQAKLGCSSHDGGKTKYRVGETVRPDSWNDDFTQECASGIHFFITRAEAEAYDL